MIFKERLPLRIVFIAFFWFNRLDKTLQENELTTKYFDRFSFDSRSLFDILPNVTNHIILKFYRRIHVK